ncbi:MAG: 2-dehydro-3-deoxygalactonokinase [Caulobacterales bacterium]
MAPALLSCDWGSTHLRAWILDDEGAVADRRDFLFGVNRLGPGEAERRFYDDVRPALGAQNLPALLCGAIGSNVGWRTAPYVDCPAALGEIAAAVTGIAEDVWIVPGLRCEGLGAAGDVLRGEETKAMGWLALDPSAGEGRRLVCQPGTHPKWLVIEDGRVARFLSAFTGELFAVLRAHSILRGEDTGAENLATFDEGVAAAADGDALLNRIYAARSRVAGRGAPRESTGDYLSGLLIGAEVAGTPRLLGLEGEPVVLLGDRPLCDRYARALARRGTATTFAEGEPAVRAGLMAIARLRGLFG